MAAWRLLALAMLGSLLLGCGLPMPTATPAAKPAPPAPSTLAQLYQRLEQAVSRPGQVLHIVTTISSEQGPLPSDDGRTEYWVDALRRAARVEVKGSAANWRAMLYLDDTLYFRDWDGRRSSQPRAACFGAGVAAEVILGCTPADDPVVSDTIAPGAYDARQALVWEHVSRYHKQDGDWLLTTRRYFDSETLLPFVEENRGTRADTGEAAGYGRVDYALVEFLSREGVDPSLFAPASIGSRKAG